MDKEIKTCSRCKTEKSLLEYYQNSNICKSCKKEYQKLWRRENKHKHRKYSLTWAKQNRDKCNIIHANWIKRNLDKHAATQGKRRSYKLLATPIWANDFFIKEIYHLAKIRTEITGIKWHVDHIVPLKSKIVCGLHCEANLQVIPAIENLMKHNKYWPNMPEVN